MGTSETYTTTDTKLKRIAWLSQQDPERTFDCLMHMFNERSLLDCFHKLDGKKAVGIDGVSKADYAKNLETNIPELHKKMRDMAYRPEPVREVLIPKEGKPGATRPLGISILEDKIVQKRMQEILESIYEPIFLECSHGFRPKRSCHTAIRALQNHLHMHVTETVIDIDLKNFFGTINHTLLENLLKEKIKDTKFMRYISRMFKAGVLSKGDLSINDDGVPQGSICSPILSNIFAHYAIDIWIEMIKPHCEGMIKLFRYADDAVICCQSSKDAQRIRSTLVKRLEKFGLQLNEEKTKLISFDKKKAAQGITQETFDFLGFTFYWGRSLGGRTIPKLKTRGKTMRAKLNRVTEWIRKKRNRLPLGTIWKTFTAKLRGHVQYYGVSHNFSNVQKFLHESTRIFFKWINRRSQRKSFDWKKFSLFMKKYPLPEVRIVHPLF